MAGNQLGKTLAGGFEVAMHATGRYPEWWKGKRFDRPTVGWACGVTGEVVRDTVQKVLVGRTGRSNPEGCYCRGSSQLAAFPTCWTRSGSITTPVVSRLSDSKLTLPVVRNSKARRSTTFGSMKSRRQTFTQKHSRAPMSAPVRCG